MNWRAVLVDVFLLVVFVVAPISFAVWQVRRGRWSTEAGVAVAAISGTAVVLAVVALIATS